MNNNTCINCFTISGNGFCFHFSFSCVFVSVIGQNRNLATFFFEPKDLSFQGSISFTKRERIWKQNRFRFYFFFVLPVTCSMKCFREVRCSKYRSLLLFDFCFQLIRYEQDHSTSRCLVCEWKGKMLKQVFGKVWNKGVFVYGGNRAMPCLYVPTSDVHNGQVHSKSQFPSTHLRYILEFDVTKPCVSFKPMIFSEKDLRKLIKIYA